MNTLAIVRYKVLFSSVILTGILSACGGGSSGPSSDTTNPPPPPPPPQSKTQAPVMKTDTGLGSTFSVEGTVTSLAPDSGGTLVETEGDLNGRTLYLFDLDAVGVSACTSNECLTNWPALTAAEGDTAQAPFSIIERTDGFRQWALRDKPLYLFVGDNGPGEVNGEGIGGVWRVATEHPAHLNKGADNDQDGDYLVASGRVLTGVSGVDSLTLSAEVREGFSLYTFDIDEPGVSKCADSCIDAWPALLAQEGDTATAPFSLIDRADTTAKQWAYNNQPLYFFVNDTAAGDTNGKALPNWRLARLTPFEVATSSLGSLLVSRGLVKTAVADGSGGEEVSEQAKQGFVLYTFDNDPEGSSTCTDSCLTAWPALIARSGAEASAPFSLITRPGGELQWALNGSPLYFFAGDEQAGDTNGDGVNGVWQVARSAPVSSGSDSEGTFYKAHGNIVDADGNADNQRLDFTVYTFAEDTAGLSTCYNSCATTWPPLYAPADAQPFGDFSVIVRDDPANAADDNLNIKQWSYKNQPLYFFIGDTQPGDLSGEYGTWFIARP